MRTLLLITILLSLNTIGATVTDSMLRAIAMQESSNRNGIVGDLHLQDHSYGTYQIRAAYLADVNKNYKKDVLKTWGRLLTLEDMQYSPSKSKFVVKRYLEYYGGLYQKKTGKEPTAEVLARIHNGGPSAWNPKYKKLYQATSNYSKKVMKHYTRKA